MNVMAEFDGLVHNAVTAMNNVLKEAAEAVDPAFGYLRDENGNIIQLFERISCEEYLDDGTHVDEDLPRTDVNPLNGKKTYHPGDNTTWFTTANLVINEDLRQHPTHLGLKLPDAAAWYLEHCDEFRENESDGEVQYLPVTVRELARLLKASGVKEIS